MFQDALTHPVGATHVEWLAGFVEDVDPLHRNHWEPSPAVSDDRVAARELVQQDWKATGNSLPSLRLVV